MLDQEPFEVIDFRGDWNRTALYPKGYGPSVNCRFKDGIVYPREQVDQTVDISGLSLGSAVARFYPFRLSTAAATERYLILTYDGATGRIYDTLAATPSTPILTIVGMTDFGLQILYDRAFITPNNSSRGLASEFVYVYDPGLMTTARKAAGLKPATSLTPAVGVAGNTAPGFHLFTYAYETNTGFITKYATPAGLTIPAGTPSIVNLTGVANGPAGTVKKHLLMTTVIQNYDNNPDHYEFFFAGVINDNVTTTASINLYDTQLVQSGAYLLNQLEEIPAGLGIGVAFNRLMTWNENTTANDSLVRLSKSGDPESFNSSSGFCTTGKGEGGRLQNAREYRGVLYTFKGRRTYGLTPTDGEPNTWPPQTIDDNKGTHRFGIAEIVDAVGTSLDFLVILCLDGMYAFDGTYQEQPLTYSIEGTWRSLASRFFSTTLITCDPVTKRIFLTYNKGGSNNDNWVCDYSQGMNFESVRWSQWFLFDPFGLKGFYSMHIEPVNISGEETARLIFCSSSGAGVENDFLKGIALNEIQPTTGDNNWSATNTNIRYEVGIGNVLFSLSGISNFAGYMLQGGSATSVTFEYQTDVGAPVSISTQTFAAGYTRGKLNVVAERLVAFKFSRTATNHSSTDLAIKAFVVYGKQIWTQRPM